MREYVGIILVAISMLRPVVTDTDRCGSLYFDKPSYYVGECASLTYNPVNRTATRQWFRKDKTSAKPLNLTSSSKYRESDQGDRFILRIDTIVTDDAGPYIVYCALNFTGYAHLVVNRTRDNLKCGQLNFETNSVYRGEPAFLIFKSFCAMTPVQWYKAGHGTGVSIYPYKTSTSFTKYMYTESKTDKSFTLEIRVTELADAGNYIVSCGKSWSGYAELKVVEPIPPSDPEFQDIRNSSECTNCLSARLNVPMNVTCFIPASSEQVELSMLKSERQLPVEQSEFQSKTSITTMFIPTEDDFNAVFTCKVKNPALKDEKIVSRKLYIEVDPDSVNIKTQPTKENETSNVQCTTINGRPPTTSLFYIKNKLHPKSVNITKTIQSGYTYNVTTTLWTKLTRQDNQATVYCCIDSSRRVCSNTENLNVTFPPQSVVLSVLSKASEENGDTVLQVKCDVDESNPKSIVYWQGVNNLPSRLLDEKYVDHTKTHGWTYTTSWMFNLTKEDGGRNITCQVKNSEFPHLVLQKSYRPNITYSPVISTSENGIKTVLFGNNVMLSCNVDSNPPSVVTWLSKSNKIKESNGTNKLDLHLVNVTVEHSQTYTCTATNGIGMKSKDVTLSVKVPSEKAYIQPSSEASRFSLIVPVIGGAVAIIIAIVTVVVFLTIRKKRNDAQPKRKGTHQIKDEPRHESVNLARNEPLHNEIPASNEKEIDNAPEYACVIPKANRKHGTNELKPEDTPEYSGVIPKSKRKSETDLLKSADGTEYACVIPKAQRKQEMDQRKTDGASAKSQGDTLVYAELDLNLDSKATTRRPLTKQYESTEYVTIDFSKTGTIKIEKEEIEEEPKIEHDEMREEGVKKENKDM